MSGSRLRRFGVSTEVNSILGWVLVGGIRVAALVNFALGRVLDAGFAAVIILLVLAPVIFSGNCVMPQDWVYFTDSRAIIRSNSWVLLTPL